MSLKKKYIKDVIPTLKKELGIKNVMAVPKITKVVLNMWIGTYVRSWNKDFSWLQKAFELLAGQKSQTTFAKKSISNFKIREWMPVWMKITLRWEKMYAFLNKLIHVVLPRVRDFRWLSKKSFDRDGNYNLWVTEHTIFHEVPQDDVVKTHWIEITVATTATDKNSGLLLLTQLWFPFKK